MAALGLCACGGTKRSAEEGPPASVRGGVLDYLPFTGKTVSSFRTRTDLGQETLVVMEFERPASDRGEIWIAGHRQGFRLSETSVERSPKGFLLKAPLAVGNSFAGPFGQVTIVGVRETAVVPAGTFPDCLRTEEVSEIPPRTVETTYCRGVGMVKIAISGAGDDEVTAVESVLLAHGPRADLSAPGGAR